MKLISTISILATMLYSCSLTKTVYVSNKTGSPITLTVDSSYHAPYAFVFNDSLNGLRIEHKKVIDYGKGRWTKEDKKSLEDLIKHTKLAKDGSATATDIPNKTRVTHISFNVEELWLNIK